MAKTNIESRDLNVNYIISEFKHPVCSWLEDQNTYWRTFGFKNNVYLFPFKIYIVKILTLNISMK